MENLPKLPNPRKSFALEYLYYLWDKEPTRKKKKKTLGYCSGNHFPTTSHYEHTIFPCPMDFKNWLCDVTVAFGMLEVIQAKT